MRPSSNSVPELSKAFSNSLTQFLILVLILVTLLEVLFKMLGRFVAGIDLTHRFSCPGYDSLINITTRKTSSTATLIDYFLVEKQIVLNLVF